MQMANVSLGPLGCERDGGKIDLRREAVAAVARHVRLREELVHARARAAWVERKASGALERGEEMRARQILAKGICTLKARDDLERDLASARSRVLELLDAILRAESPAWETRRRRDVASRKGGGAC